MSPAVRSGVTRTDPGRFDRMSGNATRRGSSRVAIRERDGDVKRLPSSSPRTQPALNLPRHASFLDAIDDRDDLLRLAARFRVEVVPQDPNEPRELELEEVVELPRLGGRQPSGGRPRAGGRRSITKRRDDRRLDRIDEAAPEGWVAVLAKEDVVPIEPVAVERDERLDELGRYCSAVGDRRQFVDARDALGLDLIQAVMDVAEVLVEGAAVVPRLRSDVADRDAPLARVDRSTYIPPMTTNEPSRRAHVLQHVPFEGLGSIQGWLDAAHYSVTWTRLHRSDQLPPIDDVDLLIVLGGPMSVNDEAGYPWLRAEKRFIRDAIGSQTAVLGICLGAQLIAAATGARVYANRHREIGWFPVRRVPAAATLTRAFPDSFDAFHWHGETFDLPAGATHLARSDGCEHQAFMLGPKVVGLQFHLETTPDSARSLVDHCRDELTDGPYVQTEAAIVAADATRYDRINVLMERILRLIVQ